MSTQHTPGPWSVNFKKFDEVTASNGAIVASCNKLTGLVNLQANARLIAAAPDLLEALKGLVAWADDLRREDPVEDLRKARAAISKAEGQ